MWDAIFLTAKLAAITTLLLLILATPLAWWLARSTSWWKEIIGAITALPLVLPPTVLGFYLLLLLSPQSPVGAFASQLFGHNLPFTFTGLVIGSVIYSLPFMVQPVRNAFEAIGTNPYEAAATLRAGPLDRFFSIALPLAKPGLISGAVLTFAHTVGEFGVILMIGGNIPGETQVLSIAIYDHVEALEYQQAHILSAGLLAFAFLVIFITMISDKRQKGRT